MYTACLIKVLKLVKTVFIKGNYDSDDDHHIL